MAAKRRARGDDALEGGSGGGGGGAGAAPQPALSLRDRVLTALERAGGSLTSQRLQAALPAASLAEIAGVLQGLMGERRVEAYAVRQPYGLPRTAVNDEHTYKLVSAEKAARLKDLQAEDLMVLQHVERGGTQGVWVRNIKIATRLQQVHINKILRKLESRKLIKPVKSVAFKNRRMYMLFDLEPDKALTGGPWYTEQQLDLSFVAALRK